MTIFRRWPREDSDLIDNRVKIGIMLALATLSVVLSIYILVHQ